MYILPLFTAFKPPLNIFDITCLSFGEYGCRENAKKKDAKLHEMLPSITEWHD